MTSYFAELPPEERARLNEIAAKFGQFIPGSDPFDPISDAAAAVELLCWQQLEAEILDAHAAWLEKAKASVERSGREWTRESFLRWCALRECE